MSDCQEAEELVTMIISAAEHALSEGTTHLRLYLTGSFDPDLMSEVLQKIVAANQKTKLTALDLQNLTVPIADGNALKNDPTLRGAFYRELYPKLIDEDPAVRRRAAKALQLGLCAIDGRAIPTEEGRQ